MRIDGETVWLTQAQLAELFDKGRSTITEHIQNIFKEGELDGEEIKRLRSASMGGLRIYSTLVLFFMLEYSHYDKYKNIT